MEIVLVLLSWAVFGGAASFFASKRGRDPLIWFLIGLFLGVLGLLILFLLPPLKLEEEPVDLEVITSSIIPQPELYVKEWFYLGPDRKQIGPIPFHALKAVWIEGKMSEATLVWSDGMEKWQTIKDLTDLNEELRK